MNSKNYKINSQIIQIEEKMKNPPNTKFLLNIENNDYLITSNRKIIGKLLIFFRRFILEEIKRYVNPVIQSQVANNDLIRLRLEYLENKIELLENNVNENTFSYNKKLSHFYSHIINTSIHNFDCHLNTRDKILATNDTNCTEKKLDLNYYQYTEKFGGTESNIRDIYSPFINYFLHAENVLDIGSGRGFFLDLLKENRINSYGIDIDQSCVDLCNRKNLLVINDDAISHLRLLEDKSLGGVFSAHVLEHIPINEVIEIIKLCYCKMRNNSYIIVIFPNITNILVSSVSFYLDPTHQTHLHPDLLKYVFEESGFKDIKDEYFQPTINNIFDIESIVVDKPNDNDELKKIFNNVIEINKLLFCERDCAVIGRKDEL